jgi:uncharacterized membrane protein YozB (DUF420 family)
MLTGPQVILLLKCAVGLVTILLIASGIALAKRKYRLHGVINTWMASLTLLTVMGFELLVRVVGIKVTDGWDDNTKFALKVHLCFVIPLVPILVFMLITGWQNRIKMHLSISVLFLILWVGMFITGMFFLPHS